LKREVSLLKERILNAKKPGFFSLCTGLINPARTHKKTRMFRIQSCALITPIKDAIHINQGSLPDLLDFDQKGGRLTRWDFLADAMRRLEEGDRPYTWSERGRLLACAWCSDQRPNLDGNLSEKQIPTGAAVLEGFYNHPQGHDRWLSFLEAIIQQVAQDREGGQVFAVVQAAEAAFGTSLETIGFLEIGKTE
jgi:hypothetical protein